MRQKVFVVVMLVAFTFGLFVPASAERRKTGLSKDNHYTDNLLSFQMQALGNWKVKTYSEKPERPKLERVMMTKKNYQVNPYIVKGSHYTIPTVIIYSDTSSLSSRDVP